MRIWDIDPSRLCRSHLLGEHRELHAIWSVISLGKQGYARHPETMRWRGRLAALYRVHERIVAEMKRRGYRHLSDLPVRGATGKGVQRKRVTPLAEQIGILRGRGCECRRRLASNGGKRTANGALDTGSRLPSDRPGPAGAEEEP